MSHLQSAMYTRIDYVSVYYTIAKSIKMFPQKNYLMLITSEMQKFHYNLTNI